MGNIIKFTPNVTCYVFEEVPIFYRDCKNINAIRNRLQQTT